MSKRRILGVPPLAPAIENGARRLLIPIDGVAGASLGALHAGARSGGSAIVLQHGYGGCAETWHHQIAGFLGCRRVIVPELRGHGRSDAPMSDYDIHTLVRDLEHQVDSAGLHESFTLVGHSFGGCVAAAFAAKHPSRVSHLILISTPSEFPLPAHAKLLLKTPMSVAEALWPLRPRWNAPPHVMQRMMFHAILPWRGSDVLPTIRVPTLCISGARDAYLSAALYSQTAALIPGAQCKRVENVGHKVQLRRPEAIKSAIDRFDFGAAANFVPASREPISELEPSRHHLSAIDDDRGARGKPSPVTREVQHGARNLFGLAEPALGDEA